MLTVVTRTPKMSATSYSESLLLHYVIGQCGQRQGKGGDSAPLCHLDMWDPRLCSSWSTCDFQHRHKIRRDSTEAVREFIAR